MANNRFIKILKIQNRAATAHNANNPNKNNARLQLFNNRRLRWHNIYIKNNTIFGWDGSKRFLNITYF